MICRNGLSNRPSASSSSHRWRLLPTLVDAFNRQGGVVTIVGAPNVATGVVSSSPARRFDRQYADGSAAPSGRIGVAESIPCRDSPVQGDGKPAAGLESK